MHGFLVRDLTCSVKNPAWMCPERYRTLLTPKTLRISVLLMTYDPAGRDDINNWDQTATGKKGSRKSATASALHSSIEDDTSPSTEPGVCPGLYQDELSFAVQASYSFIVIVHNGGKTYTGFPVRGLITFKYVTTRGCELVQRLTFSGSKFFLPSTSSLSNFPEP